MSEIAVPPPAPAPAWVGQGTAIEQSRAVAQVLANLQAARAFPRRADRAVELAREAGGRFELADRAFYRFKRGGQPVTGSTVYLARELARCWTNVDYGVTELARHESRGQSEMMAYATDLEANLSVRNTFIVPHTRDKDGSTVPLLTSRDVYENNANAGARRLREAIYSVLPGWYVFGAEEVCRATVANPPGDRRTHAERVAGAITRYRDRWGVSERQLVEHLGRPVDEWAPLDVAALRMIDGQLDRREATVAELFDPDTATAGDLQAQVVAAAAAPARGRGRRPAAAGSAPAAASAAPPVPAPETGAQRAEPDPTDDPLFGQDRPPVAEPPDDPWANEGGEGS